MTPELAEFASCGTVDQSPSDQDPPEPSGNLQPASRLHLLDPTLPPVPSPQLGITQSPAGSLKGSKSAPSLSRPPSGSQPSAEMLGFSEQPAPDLPAQDAPTRPRSNAQEQKLHGSQKQKVLIQRAPQRVSSWSQFDGIGGFWSRLPWPRSGSATGEPEANAGAPTSHSSQDLPALISQDSPTMPGSSSHQLHAGSLPADTSPLHHVTGAQLHAMSAAAGTEGQPGSASVPKSKPAPTGEDAPSWSGSFGSSLSYYHWPLPDDISTGFPHWANVLLGYPPTHDSLMTEEDSKEDGSETKQDADAKDRRLLMLEADRTCWTRMKLSVDMINDHLPDTYLEVVQLL